MNTIKIAIVGGSGYIGFALARSLAEHYDVRIVDVQDPQERELGNIEFVHCDIRDYDSVRHSLRGVDMVVHTAIIQIPRINEAKELAYDVNYLGTHNVCKAVKEAPETKGLILSGTWHTIGETGLAGVIDEEFGYRPDKVESRAMLYALSKVAQESIVRFYDEMSDKVFGVLRLGTVLGNEMPKGTAANIFIDKALRGESITPFRQSAYRPMLYVDIRDVCSGFSRFIAGISRGTIRKTGKSIDHIVNLYYPLPLTILELAEAVRDSVTRLTEGKVNPSVEVLDSGEPPKFSPEDKSRMVTNIGKVGKMLGIESLIDPRRSIDDIVRYRIKKETGRQFTLR